MKFLASLIALTISGAAAFSAIAPGAKVPAVELDDGFVDMTKVNLQEYTAGKNVFVVGLPGAFTPT